MFSLFHAPRAYPAVYLPFHDRFDFYNGRDAWSASIAGIPEKAVNLFCLHWLHLEVHNGGFWQYFFNSTATCAPEARRGFAAIGMPDVASVIDLAMFRVGRPFPLEKTDREKIVGDPGDRMDFSDLDRAFHDLADTRKIFRRLPRFVPYADAYAAGAA